MLFFNWAQTFFLDRSAVHNAAEVALTRLDLFFRAKPPAQNNKSGIYKPGVEVKIVPCVNGLPVISQMGAYRPTEPTEHGAKFNFYSSGQTARMEYDEILASANAQTPTTFLFKSPIYLPTNAEYAMIIKFDGSENFVLWTSVAGDRLLGTNEISKGPSGNFTGTLYSFIDDPNKTDSILPTTNYAYSNTLIDPALTGTQSLVYGATATTNEGWDTAYLQANWTPMFNETLKLNIHVARYSINGVPVITLPDFVQNNALTGAANRVVRTANAETVVSNGIMTFTAPVQTTEYVLYDFENSSRGASIYYGEPFYQMGPSWPGDKSPLYITCYPGGENTSTTIQANGSYVLANGSTFAAAGGFNNILTVGTYIVIKESAENVIQYIRQVDHITSNTRIEVSHPFTTQATNATFSIAPVGFLNEVTKTTLFGQRANLATLYNSMVNSSIRFVSHSLANVTINANGTGYSNNDVIKIIGFEDIDYAVKGNYPAYANITTNASGALTAIHFSNTGAGFTNASLLVGANVSLLQTSSGGITATPSAGSGANLTFSVGSSIKSVMGSTILANCQIINLEVHRMKPEILVNNPVGTGYSIRHRTLYYSVPDANTHNRKAYYIDTPEESANTDTLSKIFKAHTLDIPDVGKTPVLMSRSNEFVTRYANGAINTEGVYGQYFSNTAVYLFDISSNSDYQAVWLDPEVLVSHYGKYIINEEYTNEHTNFGNAVAKHVATKINLATNTFSEDILVYLNALRPANSDFKVYARLHNAQDPDPFNDTDFSLLELVDGQQVYSSAVDDSDYVELTYNLPAYPNTDFTINGSVTLRQGNLHVIGLGTHFGPNVAISDGGSLYVNGDIISFTPPVGTYTHTGTRIFAYKRAEPARYTVGTGGGGVITSLTALNVGYGWDNQANITAFTVANSSGGTSNGVNASLRFNPGLQANDMIKIYSPYIDWANSNYTIAIVDTIVSNTELKVKRTFGELSANLVGNVNINTTSNVLNGVDTTFTSDFEVGGYIAVWANSSVYEVHQITSITDANTLVMDSNGTYVNTATFYGRVEADNFMNSSISVSNLLVDRIAYPHQAFNNIQNDNVARYYNSSLMEFDAYDTLQVKIVLLSDSDNIIPKVDDVRGVCVTA